ncbi:VOC family protein [Clostridium minihomine]|nr:hypothetical protein [Clostridium minihomine]
MNFSWVTLPVKNLEAALVFYYGVLGLPIDGKHGGNGNGYAGRRKPA